MNQEEVESQLSAMFDGELPAAECELLSRRIDRDESLRARWARYALIGAAMRSEPVATARSGFALRVSAALAKERRAAGLWQAAGARLAASHWRQGALAATLLAGIAGLSILMLRQAVPEMEQSARTAGVPLVTAPATVQIAASGTPGLASPGTPGSSIAPQTTGPNALVLRRAAEVARSKVSFAFVTPSATPRTNLPRRIELADYIVAHSQYSAPLMQSNVLSALLGGGLVPQAALASPPLPASTGASAEPPADAVAAGSQNSAYR